MISSPLQIASGSGTVRIEGFVLLWMITFRFLRFTSADVCVVILRCGNSAQRRAFLRVFTPHGFETGFSSMHLTSSGSLEGSSLVEWL